MNQIETRPSSASIWTKCALAPRLFQLAPPEEQSDPAREGTCAAWVAECMLRGETDMLDRQHENGWVVDQSMIGYVTRYVDMLRQRGGTIDVERKVRLNENIAGTPDAFAVMSDGHLFVDDLKYGYEIVDVTTPQIVIYAGAILRHLSSHGTTVRQVTLGIYQPRAYHPDGIHRQRTLWPEELMHEVHAIEVAAVACRSDTAMATPGTHCRRCSGAAYCAAAAHTVYEAYHRMLNGQQRHMTADELAAELEFLDLATTLFKARNETVRAEVDARMNKGENIPGWTRESGYGNRRWTVDATTVALLTGVDPKDTSRMVTPLELERRGAAAEIVALLTETPRTKATLKPVPKGYYAARFGGTTE